MPRKVRAERASLYVSLLLAAAALSCGGAEDSGAVGAASAAGGGGSAPAGGTTGAGDAPLNPLGRARCQAPAGVSGSPKTIQQAIDLLNALPKPTSVACFVESLERPLAVYATSSTFSAQPAHSAASPRLFFKLDSLWLSVVIDGDSSYLIEFGYELPTEPPRSIKGELLLPVATAIAASAPYDRVRYGQGTVCGLCHYFEEAASDGAAAAAFSSIAFRPTPDSRVTIDVLRAAAATCDWQSQPHRCEMLAAVFGGGAVEEVQFPDSMSTFF